MKKTKKKNKNNLKNMAIAYKLACEFDYCPNEQEYEEAKNYYGDFSLNVLVDHQGKRSDEIAREIVEELL